MKITLRTLGYAGLIPFVALPLLQVTGSAATALPPITLFSFYSVVILGFMAGVLWPARAAESAHGTLAWLAVTPPVVGFLTLAFFPGVFLWVQLLLFLALRAAEMRLQFDRHYAPYYRTLRWHLTIVVVACHVWMIALSGSGFTLN
ncbi:DUF3429 domain-containing protein [Salinispirillum sp. LH 10-3-1]|uniref:DUF3429 domain-containing protein n=1 Tax=Salinispirillum sp. LH 10-3-1 TaxID=2952525 RepID=A0AB38YHI1_9GAMM